MNPTQKPKKMYTKDDFSAYGDYFVLHRLHKIDPHFHEGFELLYIVEGESHINIGSKVFVAKAGDLIIFHPGVVHEEEIQPGSYRIFCLRFSTAKIKLPFPDEGEHKPVLRLPWPERFHNLLEQIVLEKQGLDGWSERMVGLCLTQFVILLWRALSQYQQHIAGEGDDKKLRIGHIIDLIYAGIDTDVPLKDLASMAFMSESHFSRTFKGVTGLAPKRYMIGARIEKGRELLATTDKSVTEIGYIIGFESPAYFNRLFKKKVGCTPLEYRKNSIKVQS
jgi:AraC family transcriptional regulator of arabinose operon